MLCTAIVSMLVLGAPASGLQVKVLRPGSGPAAVDGDILTMLYRGTLKDGKVFDDNMKSAPYAFKLGAGEVITGWDRGLKGAKAGAKMRLVVPPDMGYGSQANGPIPPNSTLTFEVEVLRIDNLKQRPAVKIVDLKVGTGAVATPNSKVAVNYKGYFLNGVVFDQSRGRPMMFQLGSGSVVPGYETAIIGMRVGGKRKAVIPYRLAYGESGRPPKIPGRSTLVFELELMNASR